MLQPEILTEGFKLPSLGYKDALVFAIACGLTAHLVYNKLEPRAVSAHAILLLLAPTIPAIFLAEWMPSHVLAVYGTYHHTLVSSVLLYRLSPFHPLSRYPGPLLARLSMLWSLHMVSTGRRHIVLKELHERYGPYVRVGPNELSICDAEAIHPIMGTDGMPKGPRWHSRKVPGNAKSLIMIGDPVEHAHRRRFWARGFTSESVREYEPLVAKRALQLVDALERESSPKRDDIPGATRRAVDLARWLGCFTFDFMGDMAFGGGFEHMTSYDADGIKEQLQHSLKIGAIVENLPWIGPFLFQLGMLNSVVKFKRFANHRARLRIERGPAQRDLFTHLIDEDGHEPTPPPLAQTVTDSGLAIIAGSDTTASVMTGILFYLLRNPDAYARLKAEVDAHFPPGEGEPFDAMKLAQMEYLNAVINEGLRLLPAVPSGSQRAPREGSGGKVIGSHYIPEGTSAYIPNYVLHRDPRYFSPEPDKFLPERWLPPSPGARAQFSTTAAAFIPFSFGPANCVGKKLAILEMRMVISLLVQRFHIRPADLRALETWEDTVQDWTVVQPSPLKVVLTPRI